MSTVTNGSKPSPKAAAKKVVEQHPGVTVEGVAQLTGIARSTAGKLLARLADADELTRHTGGRDGGKRLPDRFTLKSVPMPAAYALHVADSPAAGASGVSAKKDKGAAKRPSSKRGKAVSPPKGKAAATRARPASKGAKRQSPAKTGDGSKRLRAGGLDPLVLDYLEQHKEDAPHGPSQVAKALGRSSGAVGNCLARLTAAKKATQVTHKPRRYDLAA
jgi:hypothetical protein